MRAVAEVNVFEQQIGSEQQVFPRAARPVNRAVVADAH
jgi:hypothetical protein